MKVECEEYDDSRSQPTTIESPSSEYGHDESGLIDDTIIPAFSFRKNLSNRKGSDEDYYPQHMPAGSHGLKMQIQFSLPNSPPEYKERTTFSSYLGLELDEMFHSGYAPPNSETTACFGKVASFERFIHTEAEEWRDVLSYFCGGALGAEESPAGIDSISIHDNISAAAVMRNVSYGSLFF